MQHLDYTSIKQEINAEVWKSALSTNCTKFCRV